MREEALPGLPFDERLCILMILLERIYGLANQAGKQERLAESLRYFAEGAARLDMSMEQACREQLKRRAAALQVKKDCGLMTAEEEEREHQLEMQIENSLQKSRIQGEEPSLISCAERVQEEAQQKKKKAVEALQNGIGFVRDVFGEGQELTIAWTGLLEQPETAKLLKTRLLDLYQEAKQFLSTKRREEELRRRLLQ